MNAFYRLDLSFFSFLLFCYCHYGKEGRREGGGVIYSAAHFLFFSFLYIAWVMSERGFVS